MSAGVWERRKQGTFAFSHLMVAIVMLVTALTASGQPVERERVSIDADWLFQRGDAPGSEEALGYAKVKPWVMATGNEFVKDAKPVDRPAGNVGENVLFTQAKFDDGGWRHVDLPHDWGIEGPFKQELPGDTGKLPWAGVGWYRKHLAIPSSDAGKRLCLDVDGAMAYSAVWCNGQFVGGWPYGYASFELDLTPYLKVGTDNVVAVRLDNPLESSRWYPGGGIYRNVWLVKTPAVHVAHWGTYVTTPEITSDAAQVAVKVTVANESAASEKVTVKTTVHEVGKDGKAGEASVASSELSPVSVDAGAREVVAQTIRLAAPRLWGVGSPNLYVAETTLEKNGRVIDRYETTFGVRTISFDPEKGFLLNGQHVMLKGVCDHSDLGALGTVVNVRGLQRQIEILQEMGCNAIRTSHNPPAPELLDLCDRMGVLVMDESFDCWAAQKKKNDYHLLFPDWHERDWRAEIRRDRNHPSIVLWSIGNEVREQGNEAGHAIAADLTRIAHEEDPTRPTTAACNNGQAGYNGFQKTVDVFGYNYRWSEYPKFLKQNPGMALFGSETSSCVSSRGEYFFPVSDDKSLGRADFQVSSYDLYAPRWAWPPDAEFKAEDKNPAVMGEFVWTGFDYLGEPTPYNGDTTNLLNFTDPQQQARMAKEMDELKKIRVPSRSSYFGIIDLAGFKKDRFYIYQACWRPELAMAHILPHWNWPGREGQVTPVHVYTSGDEGELFLNGKSQGRKKRGQYEYRLRWDDVKYEPGEVKVVTYKDGKEWATDVMKTTGAAAKVLMKPDRADVAADGKDLCFVTVTIADKDGLMVPRSKNHLKFEISGPGEIVAVDNGDATSFEPFQASERNAYNGLALVIVRPKAGEGGTLTLKATSEGLDAAEATIRSAAVK